MVTMKRAMLACCAVMLATTMTWAQAHRTSASRIPEPSAAGSRQAQDPHIFLVEAGSGNNNVVAEPNTAVTLHVYAEVTEGGSVTVSGFQFTVPCSSVGGDGPAIMYVAGSVEASGAGFFPGLDPVSGDYHCASYDGSCPSSDPLEYPNGACVATPPNVSTLDGAVKIGEVQYAVPSGAVTCDPSGNPYVISIVDSNYSFILDENGEPIDNVVFDGVSITIPNGQCCDGNTCVPGPCPDGQMTEEACHNLSPAFMWIEGKSCLDPCICEDDYDCDDGNECMEDRCDPSHPDAGPDGCVHTPVIDGTECPGDPCILGEVCQSGVCTGGSPVDCSGAGDQCNVALCDPNGDEGNCDIMTPVPDGTECPGDPCILGEVCQSGVCTGGSPVDCSGAGDQCNVALCDPNGDEGNCDIMTPVPDGTECPGDPCILGEVCQSGVCTGGSPVDCSGAGDQCNVASCDPNGDEGNCDIMTPVPDGTECPGDPCILGEVCQSGVCTGGSPVDCSGAGDQCNVASCDPNGDEGNCDIMTPVPDGTECPGDPCILGEVCQSGACTGGSPVDCSGAGDQCNVASCDPNGNEGNCDIMTPVPDGTECPGDPCILGEVCQSGVCTGGSPVDCSGAGDQCNVASCDPNGDEGNCDIMTPVPDGTECPGDPCILGEVCQSGACTGGSPVDCSGAGDQCNVASCDPNGNEGNCDIMTPVPDGTECPGDPCILGEVCQSGVCTGGSPVDCSGAGDQCNVASCDPNGDEGNCDIMTPVPDGTPCGDPGNTDCDNPDTCDENGVCVPNHEPAGTPCPDDLWCNGDETCDGAGLCQEDTPRCDDGIECTSDPCNEFTQTCEPKFPHHELCDDGDICNGLESCDIALGCQAGTALECDDGNDCTENQCDPVGGCMYPPSVAGTPCGDPNESPCDHPDSCDGDGGCLPNFEPSGTPCPNGLYCDGDEFCDDAGVCVPGTSPCDDGIDCTDDFCDEEADVCAADPQTCGNLDLTLHAEDGCFKSAQDVCVTIDSSNLDGQAMIGGQFFIEYNACLLEFVAMSPGDHPELSIAPCFTPGESPFSSEIFENVSVDGCMGRIEYAVGLPLGGQPSAADNTMATIHFTTIYPDDPGLLPPVGQGNGPIRFDLGHAPATQLSDYLGTPNFPALGAEIPITVDDNPPVFACPDIEGVPNDPGECTAVVGAVPCMVEDDGTEENPGCGLCDLDWSRSDGLPLPAPYPVGTTCITWVATDCAGNVAVHEQCITIIDTQDPEILCPVDVEVSNDPGDCGAIVTYPDPVVSDNCPGVMWECLPASGSHFDLKNTAVTCVATDANGRTSECSFTVTVTDEEQPELVCPADITQASDPGECDAIVDYPDPVVSDNCPGVMWECLPASGSHFDVGNTEVCCTATDAAGHANECCFVVTIEDSEPPEIMCPEVDPVNAGPGECNAVVTFEDPEVSDNCPGVMWECNHLSGSLFDVGDTTVTCTATDAAGSTSECFFPVTVLDREPPEITCPADVTRANDPGECGAIVHYPDPVVSDNCPGVMCECLPASGSLFGLGDTTVTCTATDAAGNTSACTFLVTVRDEESPELACPADITQANDPGECRAVVHYPDPVVSDNCSGMTWECLPASGSLFDVGDTTVTCTATDAAGNVSNCSFNVTVTDNEDPIISCPTDITRDNDPGVCGAIVDYPDPVVGDNCPGVTWECLPASGSFFNVGDTTVTCTATDVAGKSRECSFTVMVTEDEDPTIECPADITRANDPGVCGAVVHYPDPVVSDNCPGVTWECTPPSGSHFDVGETTVTCTATDAAGNTSACTFLVTVRDEESPELACPADITQANDPGECRAVVHYPDPVVSDNCSGMTWECLPASGSLFDVGDTTVTCTATDAAGNVSNCSFNVTVTDNEDPIISCPTDITRDNDPGVCGAIVAYPDPPVNDNCTGVTWECDPPSGSFFDVGDTPVVCTATDVAENTARCTFTVTVLDKEPPEITCPADITRANDPGVCGAVVHYPDPVVSDNCPGVTWECTPPSGSHFDVGGTTVTCTATDAAGNTSACTFLVTVRDEEPPELSCPADITRASDPGECDAIVDYPDPVVSDNCPGVTWECTPPSGSHFDVGETTVTCTATDAAGNTSACSFLVTITEENTLDLVIRSEAANLYGECPRCVSFVLHSCDEPCSGSQSESYFEEVRLFENGVASFTIDVPYGTWGCISAKDDLHTLQSTVSLGVSEGHFVADFTGDDRLLCGDADNNNVVDINDYAILFTQYMTWPELPATKCDGADAPPPYHTDFDCDDRVTTGDFLCILFNFLKFGDEADACCPTRAVAMSRTDGVGGTETPTRTRGDTRIPRDKWRRVARTAEASVAVEDIAAKIGMEAAMAADIDGNGVLDVADMALFSQGRSIELPERFREIMLEQAVPVEDVAPVAPRR